MKNIYKMVAPCIKALAYPESKNASHDKKDNQIYTLIIVISYIYHKKDNQGHLNDWSKVRFLADAYEKHLSKYVNLFKWVSTTSNILVFVISREWYYSSLQFSIFILFTNNNLVPQLFLLDH